MKLIFMAKQGSGMPANLYDASVTDINGAINTAGGFSEDAIYKTTYFACEPNTTYTITMYRTCPFRVVSTAEIPAVSVSTSNYQKHAKDWASPPSVDTMTYTTTATAAYVAIFYWADRYGTIGETRSTIRIEKVTP